MDVTGEILDFVSKEDPADLFNVTEELAVGKLISAKIFRVFLPFEIRS